MSKPQTRRSTEWHRDGSDWHLTLDGQPRARIIRDGLRWLCYTATDHGDDGFIGPAHSLASAKTYLERRTAHHMRRGVSREEVPL
ncbi:MAG: hypothetical protein K2X41_00945 [Hyphomicrobium sp.]|nr:hypothetical protein [Hyphomicrobium sp.]